MQLDEIERYLAAGRGHSIVIDVQRVAAVSGVLRIITLHRRNRVTIEFDRTAAYTEGDIEGWGPKYVGEYKTLADAVESLERYLGTPLERWTNYTATPFVSDESDAPFDAVTALAHFERLVKEGRLPMPHGTNYSAANTYWRHIERYGEYREDRLFEEQEARWKD